MGYQFRTEYEQGLANRAADPLSRLPEGEKKITSAISFDDPGSAAVFLVFFSNPIFELLPQIQVANTIDPYLLKLHEQYQQGKLPPTYSIDNGMLFFKDRYVLSSTSPLVALLLQEFHDTPSGGHAGIKRTLVRLAGNFFWPGMRESVTSYVAQYTICQQIKSSTDVPSCLLQPFPIPAAVWDDATMDFVIALPLSRGMSVILVIVDRLSKYAHFGA